MYVLCLFVVVGRIGDHGDQGDHQPSELKYKSRVGLCTIATVLKLN